MRRLFSCLLLLGVMTPLVARAESRDGAFVEKRARVRAEPRKAKSTLVLKSSSAGSLPAVSPARAGRRPDVCSLLQNDKQGVALRTHLIERGDSLSGIAWRHGTSVKALAAANGLSEAQTIKTGQRLVIPQHSRLGGGDDWLRYAGPPKERGRLDLITHKDRFRGQVVESGRISPAARRAVSELLGAKGEKPPISERLLRLLVRVSDTFGGRQIHVVSGYRTSSYFADSRHKTSEAVDFSIVGVPNVVLRQYLLLLDNVGVGFYPNSSFIHLDVRGCAMQWVDYAGPGEAPRKSPRQPARSVLASKGKDKASPVVDVVSEASGASQKRPGAPRPSDVDDIAEEVVAAMEEAPKLVAPPLAKPDDHDAQGGGAQVRAPSRDSRAKPDGQSE
jgi:uncharacterized protein YcbK (DUF882 family)